MVTPITDSHPKYVLLPLVRGGAYHHCGRRPLHRAVLRHALQRPRQAVRLAVSGLVRARVKSSVGLIGLKVVMKMTGHWSTCRGLL